MKQIFIWTSKSDLKHEIPDRYEMLSVVGMNSYVSWDKTPLILKLVTEFSKDPATPIFRVIKKINDSKNLKYVYFFVIAILILTVPSQFFFNLPHFYTIY
jgi:hypothetical protein